MTLPARSYFQNPGLLTIKQVQFLVNAALAGEGGMSFPQENVIFVRDLIKLGFLFYITQGGEARVYITSTGDYICELAHERIKAMRGERKTFQILQGGKA